MILNLNHYWQIDFEAKGIHYTRNFSVNSPTSSKGDISSTEDTPSKADNNFAKAIANYKANGGTIANLCSRTMRIRSHGESTKNSATRVQNDADKLGTFWMNQTDIDPAKLSPQKRTEAEALLKKAPYFPRDDIARSRKFLKPWKRRLLEKGLPWKNWLIIIRCLSG